MTLTLKVLAMFTLSMGTLIFEIVTFIYGWIPAHMALVTGVLIIWVNIPTLPLLGRGMPP